MNKYKYTVVISGYNEENRIEDALKRVFGKAHILIDVIDGNDRTAEIAQKYGAKIIRSSRQTGSDALKNWYLGVFEHIETDYMLLWMLSHTHTNELLNLYDKIAREAKYKAVGSYIAAYSYGARVNAWRTPFKKQKLNRLSFMFFDKNYVDVSKGVIHNEYPFVGCIDQIYYPPKNIEYCIRAFRDDDAASNDEKHIRYGNLEAIHRYEGGQRTNGPKILAMFIWQFWLSYIWRRSIFQGVPGLITSLWYACYLGNVQIRLWELQNGWTRKKIMEDHQRMKEVIR
jgi:glycosyltransferase involved in cell wall biosynthesis